MLEIRQSKRAKNDIKSIWRYSYEQWGEAHATRYCSHLERAILQLGDMPKLGMRRDKIREGLRGYHVKRHVIYYYVRNDHIYVVRVRHDQTDPYLYEE